MYSRAHLLIKRDLEEIHNSGCTNIIAFALSSENLFDVVAKIEGPPNSIWDSGVFQLYLKFSDLYNDVPPHVSFQTIPFHPNIDVSTGKPSIDFLDDPKKWKSQYTIKFILESLQQLLAYPLLDRAVNMDAVFMLKGNYERYKAIAQESVIASHRIQRGLEPFSGVNTVDLERQTTSVFKTLSTPTNNNFTSTTAVAAAPHTPLYSTRTLTMSATLPATVIEPSSYVTVGKERRQTKTQHHHPVVSSSKRVSFEDYYRMWTGMATSKERENAKNVYLQYDLNENPVQMAQHLGLTLKDLEIQMMQQLNDHKNIMYGKFSFSKHENLGDSSDEADYNGQERIMKMKNIYLKKSDNTQINRPESKISESETNVMQENAMFVTIKENENSKTSQASNWENEVDDLVDWTKNLNDQAI